MSGQTLAETRFEKPSLRMRIMERLIAARGSDFKDAQKLQQEVPGRAPPIDAPMPENFNRKFIIETWLAPAGGGSADKGSTDKGSVDKGSVDKGSTDKGSVDKGSTDKGSVDKGSTDKGSVDKGSVDKGSTDKGSTDKGSTDKGSTDKGSTDKGSHKVVTLHPKSGKGAKHIIYFHGGGFYMPMFKEHWPLVAALVEASGASVSVPLYPLVPEHDYAPTYAQADAVYDAIAAEWGDENIALCGDSAGGNLAIATALRRRDAGKSLPAQIIPFAPWLDMGMRDEDALAVEPNDAMLGVESLRILGQWWAGDRAIDDPIASPLFADLSGLPPISIFQGCHDVFVIDSRTFAGLAKEAGVPIKLYEYAGGPHVFMALTFTREAKDTFALVADILRE